MPMFEIEINNGKASIAKYVGKKKIVVIPDSIDGHSVTKIGESAFDGCTGLTSINIPNSVTKIGWRAFDRKTKRVRI